MRNLALLLILSTVSSLARAEGVEPAKRKPNTATRVYAATTMFIAPDGALISVGFSTLARKAPGARTFQTLHTIKKDSLYRVAAGERGDVLAAWENDPSIHYFTADGRHVRLAKPSSSSGGAGRLSVQSLALLPNGRDALVHMWSDGSLKSTTSDVTFRVALDGSRPPEGVLEVAGARRIDMNARRAVYVVPEKPGQHCARDGCDPVDEVVAYDFDADGKAQRTVLVKSGALQVTNAHLVWGEKDAPLMLRLDLQANQQALLTWRAGQAQPELRPVKISNLGDPRFYALATGELLETRVDYDEGLTIRRHLLDGTERLLAVPVLADPDNYDHRVHGIGVRRDGRLWMQWGDHLLFFGKNPLELPRAYSLEPLLQRRQEWAGYALYVPAEDALWVGIDSMSRDYVRVELTELERKAKRIALPAVARE